MFKYLTFLCIVCIALNPCLHQLAYVCGMVNSRLQPYFQCNKPATNPCKRKHYGSLVEVSNLKTFRALMESINPATSTVLRGSSALLAQSIYDNMASRIVDNTAVGAAPGSKMVNTVR